MIASLRRLVPAPLRRLYHRIVVPLRRRRAPSLPTPVEAAMLCAPIERADGSVVSDLRSRETWRDVTFSDGLPDERPVLLRELYAHEHQVAYPQPWLQGRGWFELLLAQGLRRDDRVLDLGCGAGRLGIWVAGHVDAGCYFGIDPHLRSLVAFSAYEMRLHGLMGKRARLMHDGDFRFDRFGERFDVALDVHLSRHLPPERRRALYDRLRACLSPRGRVFVNGLTGADLPAVLAAGFEVVSAPEGHHLLPSVRRAIVDPERWYVLRARDAAGTGPGCMTVIAG